MAGTLTPPFTPPVITDPLATDPAANGYAEFNALKNYVESFLQVQFDLTTGQFLSATVFAPKNVPEFFGDVTTPDPSTNPTQIVTTVVAINGTNLAGLATGFLFNTTSTGVPSIVAIGQIPGTATNDSAGAGKVGEIVQSLIGSGSAVGLTTATAANIANIGLTAGDWDVEGSVHFAGSSATETQKSAGISTTTATIPTDGSEGYSGAQTTTTTTKDSITLSRKRLSLSGNTTVYLVGSATFSAGSVGAFGGISARRVR